MPGKVSYKNLYELVSREIDKKVQFNTKSQYKNQLGRDSVSPVMGDGRSDASTGELVSAIQGILEEALPSVILNGLEVEATDPISSTITIASGKGSVGGYVYELTGDVTITIPFDSSTEIFYINLYKDNVLIEKSENPHRLKIAKIIVPNPGVTSLVQDDKDESWNAYIVNFKEYKLYGINDKFEEDTIELLRDNISPILADNLIGNIRLNEDLKITNTQGTLELNSNSLKLYDLDENLLTKFNQRGVYFYNTSGIEMARFTNIDARIGNILINTDSLQSTNFVSGALGSGFQIQDSGDAEFNNIRARGKITTAVFEKDVISSIGGNLLVSDSDILDVDMTALDASTLTIVGDTTFAINDILRIKDGVDDEWFLVTNISSAPTYIVTRDLAGVYTTDLNPIWKKGTAVVNFGASGEGLIFMTASESNAPYLSVVTHAGAPWSTLTTRMRLGNLNGFLGYSSDLYGIAIGETTKYLKYDSTNGLRIAGHTLLGSLDISTGGYIASGQSAYDTGTGFWMDYNTGTPRFSIGNSSGNKLTWNGTTLSINGSITVSGGDAFSKTTDDLDDIIDGANYGKVALTSISAGKIIVAGLDSTITDRMFADSTTKTNIEAWKHVSDVTKIDGGDIYTGSITANKITVTTLSAIVADLGTITAGTVTGATLQTAASGARVLINTTNLIAYDDASNEIFKILITGADVGDVIFGTPGTAYMKWDKSAGVLIVADAQSPDYVADTTGYKLSSSTGLEVNTGVIKGTIISGNLIRKEEFTSNGTFTVPAGITKVYLFMCAGGGGGGGGLNPLPGGGGGASGSQLLGYPVTVTPLAEVTVTIGAAGAAGGVDGNGGVGGNTSFGATTVIGGAGGIRGTNGGVGGYTAGFGMSLPGQNAASGIGGNGASSAFGTGGTGASAGNGGAASGYGSGGGGGSGGSNREGGAGSAGYCLVMW